MCECVRQVENTNFESEYLCSTFCSTFFFNILLPFNTGYSSLTIVGRVVFYCTQNVSKDTVRDSRSLSFAQCVEKIGFVLGEVGKSAEFM
jgi:hypothetical protein